MKITPNSHLKRTSVILLWTVLFPVLAASIEARPVKIWSLQELTTKADLVVVATAVSSTDTKNWVYPEAKDTTWVTVDTVFSIETVLKGELKGPSVTVQHFRYWKPEASVIDGPSFVQFAPSKKHRYLMFLGRKANGRYEPLTGQYDPDGSFFMLENYHISRERGAGEPAAN